MPVLVINGAERAHGQADGSRVPLDSHPTIRTLSTTSRYPAVASLLYSGSYLSGHGASTPAVNRGANCAAGRPAVRRARQPVHFKFSFRPGQDLGVGFASACRRQAGSDERVDA
eukprot:3310541-Rhodomonas_salina.1